MYIFFWSNQRKTSLYISAFLNSQAGLAAACFLCFNCEAMKGTLTSNLHLSQRCALCPQTRSVYDPNTALQFSDC